MEAFAGMNITIKEDMGVSMKMMKSVVNLKVTVLCIAYIYTHEKKAIFAIPF